MKMKTKKFDCVEMMHRCGRKIHDELDGLTIEEQIVYWRERNQAFRKEHARLKVKGEIGKDEV